MTKFREGTDEPVFVLRAQDQFAPALVEQWAREMDHWAKLNIVDVAVQSRRAQKIREARALAHQMRAWQALNRSKVPD